MNSCLEVTLCKFLIKLGYLPGVINVTKGTDNPQDNLLAEGTGKAGDLYTNLFVHWQELTLLWMLVFAERAPCPAA